MDLDLTEFMKPDDVAMNQMLQKVKGQEDKTNMRASDGTSMPL